MVIAPPLLLRAGDQPPEVPRRPRIPGRPRRGQQPLRRDPARRGRNPVSGQSAHRVVVTPPRPSGRRRATRLRTLDDALDCLMRGTAHRGGPAIRARLLVGSDDVHVLPRRFHAEKAPRAATVTGWHRHDRRPGLALPDDTTHEGWGLLTGQNRGPQHGHLRILFHGHGHGAALSRSLRSPRRVPRPGSAPDSPVARRRTGCRARKREAGGTVSRRSWAGTTAPGGRRPRGTIGDATTAHAPGRRSGIPHAVERGGQHRGTAWPPRRDRHYGR